jgi:Tol biopolymer transport system component/DNA-binding winged helix-turn-helix (wHTH) protein
MGNKSSVFRFADVEVREREYTLIKAGKVSAVEPKAFRTLLFLLHNPQRLISKEELLNSLWGDAAVTEGSLTRCIWLLRRLLEDDIHEPRYIETVATVGYRFVCPVEVSEVGGYDAGGPVAEASATPETPATGETKAKTDQPSKGTRDRNSTASANQERVNASSDVRATLSARPFSAKRILASLSVLLILAAGFLGYRALSNPARHTAKPPSRSAFSNMRITQLTNLPGSYWDPVFSPDGRQIAYFWDGERRGSGDLYVQLIGGQKPLRLTYTTIGSLCCADWSPDGQQIVFGRCNDGGGAVFIIPALGGPERKLTDMACLNFDARIAQWTLAQWTADGKSLVLADSCAPGAPRGIVVFSLQTGEKRCLHSPPLSDRGDGDPILSPDQKTVAFERWPTSSLAQIYTVAFSGGNLRRLTDEYLGQDAMTLMWSLMWSPDGKYIAFEPIRDRMARVAASGGPVEFEAVYPKIGVPSRDYRRVAYVEPSLIWSWSPAVSRLKLAHAGGKVVSEARILVSATGGDDSAQLSPDEHQLVFQSMRSGIHQIWRSNADGSYPLQLTFFESGYSGTPRWSPDGKWVAFDYHPGAHAQIYLVDSEGRNLHALTSGNYENCVASWSRDGRAVYFASNRTGDWQVWSHELSTGKEVQITRHGGFAAFESYDAKALYYSKFEGGGIWKTRTGGGVEERVTDSLHRGYWGHFAVTDNGLYLVDSDAKDGPAIMYYNFQTGRLSPVMTFKQSPSPWFPNLAASRDGRTLFYAQVEFEHNMISMVENFQ